MESWKKNLEFFFWIFRNQDFCFGNNEFLPASFWHFCYVKADLSTTSKMITFEFWNKWTGRVFDLDYNHILYLQNCSDSTTYIHTIFHIYFLFIWEGKVMKQTQSLIRFLQISSAEASSRIWWNRTIDSKEKYFTGNIL